MSPSRENEVEEAQRPRREIPLLNTVRRLLSVRLAGLGFAIIFAVVVSAIFASQIAPHSPIEQTEHYLAKPSWDYPLGTDKLGRCVLSRIIYGSRIALAVSIGAVGFGVLVGAPLGLTSAYIRGWVDEVLMRIMDAIVSFPSLIIAVALVAAIGSSLTNVIFAIGIANIPWIARLVRGQALSVRERDYVMAARSAGGSGQRIVARHIWPNSFAPVVVQATLGMAYAILTEAALGFLGLSVQPPTPTWGNMLQFAFPLLDRAPLLSIAPGMAIFLTVLGFNFVGDALRDVLDPRLRGLFR